MKKEIQLMSTRELLHAIVEFTKIHDFVDEVEDIFLELEDEHDVYVRNISVIGEQVYLLVGRLQPTYCECCGPEREYEWESSDNFTRHDLSTIVDYLSLRLIAKIGW